MTNPSPDLIRQVEAESVDDYTFQVLLDNYVTAAATLAKYAKGRRTKLIAHIENYVAARATAERKEGYESQLPRIRHLEHERDLALSAAKHEAENANMWRERALAASQAAPEKYKLTNADHAALAEASTAGLSVALLPDAGSAFINRGHDYGDSADLECEACGGSGHIEDFNAWKGRLAAAEPVPTSDKPLVADVLKDLQFWDHDILPTECTIGYRSSMRQIVGPAGYVKWEDIQARWNAHFATKPAASEAVGVEVIADVIEKLMEGSYIDWMRRGGDDEDFVSIEAERAFLCGLIRLAAPAAPTVERVPANKAEVALAATSHIASELPPKPCEVLLCDPDVYGYTEVEMDEYARAVIAMHQSVSKRGEVVTAAEPVSTKAIHSAVLSIGHDPRYDAKQRHAFLTAIHAAAAAVARFASKEELEASASAAEPVLTDLWKTQAYRTGYGQGVRKAAQMMEDRDLPVMAELIRNLQSTSLPAASEAVGVIVPRTLLEWAQQNIDCIEDGEERKKVSTELGKFLAAPTAPTDAKPEVGDQVIAYLTLGGIDGGEYDDNDIEIASSKQLEKLQWALVRTSEPVTLELIVRPTAAQSVRNTLESSPQAPKTEGCDK